MNLFIPVVLFLCTAVSPSNTPVDDVKRFLASFKDAVSIPFAQSFLEKHKILSTIQDFERKSIPCADLVATFIKGGLSADENLAMSNLLTYAVNSMESLRKQMNTVFRNLPLIYEAGRFRDQVQKPLSQLLSKINRFMKSPPDSRRIDLLAGDCDRMNELNAMHFVEVAYQCTNATIDVEANTILHNIIMGHTFKKSKLSEEEMLEYHNNYFQLYKFISMDKKRARKEIEVYLQGKPSHYESKKTLLKDIIDGLKIGMWNITRECIPLLLFEAKHFNREVMQNFLTIYNNMLYHLVLVTNFCSRILEPSDSHGQQLYIDDIAKSYPTIIDLTTTWANWTLHKTWPTTELELVAELIKEAYSTSPIPEDEDVYDEIIKYVQSKMLPIGHPGFAHSFLIVAEDTSGYDKSVFYNCKPGQCHSITVSGTTCIVFRTDLAANDMGGKVEKLVKSTRGLENSVITAMQELKGEGAAMVVIDLQENYGIDLEKFKHHSSLVVLQHSRFVHGCLTYFGIAPIQVNDTWFVQNFTYHYDGGLTEFCYHYTFFFAL